MTLKKLLSIVLIISTSIIYGAASDEEILTIRTIGMLEGANIERKEPLIDHYIEANRKETFTGKTFKTLFSNACESNLPWIITICHIIRNRSITVDYIDTLELYKRSAEQEYDFSSHESSVSAMSSLANKACEKQYPDTIRVITCVTPLYYERKNSMRFEAPSTFTGHKNEDVSGNKISISDISCTLAISLSQDYSQLLPLIRSLHRSPENEIPSLIKNQRLSFWNKTFFSLPEEQQQQLLKECNNRFGWDLSISRNQ